MDIKRKTFQGVFNIIRFNWHFYLIAGLALIFLGIINPYLTSSFQLIIFWFSLLAILAISVSLIISYLIYDCSDLYQLKWLAHADDKTVLNINAGFDETSDLIKSKFPKCNLTICDFYNAEKHTEISIRRARKTYPPVENTIQVSTDKLPFPNHTFDYALAVLSAHEIRDEHERIGFFKELNRVTKTTGRIFVTEHLRDLNNFMAYTIGFFHFHSKSSWRQTFEQANLKIIQEVKSTPFITTFILEKNGDTL